jgi:hypothetical protein
LIFIGLAIAVVALTFPFWYNLAIGSPTPSPELDTPDGQCVEDTEYMRAHHMDLLDEWRDAVVRDGDTSPVVVEGKEYPKSLTRGCLECHTTRQKFCYECHNYANVEPTCWECHVESIGD